MAIFKKVEELSEFKEDILITTPNSGTVISKCMAIEGSLKSCEPITIEGQLNGNIKCEDIVVILSTGRVKGKIEAKEVRVDGELEGPIEASLVELTEGSKQEGYILADSAVINGELDGDIIVKESLEVGKSGSILSFECKANTITVEGKLEGVITANRLLDVRNSAKIKGEITTKELSSQLGSQIIGSIKTLNNTNIINSKLNKNIVSIKEDNREIRRIG